MAARSLSRRHAAAVRAPEKTAARVQSCAHNRNGFSCDLATSGGLTGRLQGNRSFSWRTIAPSRPRPWQAQSHPTMRRAASISRPSYPPGPVSDSARPATCFSLNNRAPESGLDCASGRSSLRAAIPMARPKEVCAPLGALRSGRNLVRPYRPNAVSRRASASRFLFSSNGSLSTDFRVKRLNRYRLKS